jgi:hypothetical protein
MPSENQSMLREKLFALVRAVYGHMPSRTLLAFCPADEDPEDASLFYRYIAQVFAVDSSLTQDAGALTIDQILTLLRQHWDGRTLRDAQLPSGERKLRVLVHSRGETMI